VKIMLSPEVIGVIKADLRLSMPDVESSHRIEAIARGLGWSTNAAMRVALAHGPVERDVDPGAFTSYLAGRGIPGDSRPLTQAVLRVQVRAVRDANPRLTHFGFGLYEQHRLSVDAWRLEMSKSRDEMLSDQGVSEFERACEYLSLLDRIKTPNRKHNSYNLKHSAERYHRRHKYADDSVRAYVSNGMLLVAAYHLGFKVVPVSRTSPNAYLNVSSKSLREVADDRTPLPQPDSGQHFRVLGHNRGTFFYVPVGAQNVVALRASAHIPSKLVKLAPLDYWVAQFPPRDRRSPFDTHRAFSDLVEKGMKAGIYEPPSAPIR
jgi:hypothetical protein